MTAHFEDDKRDMTASDADGPTPPSRPARIVVVTEGGRHIWGLVDAISAHFGQPVVIMEEPDSKLALLRKRARKLGIVSAAGQLATMMLIRLTKTLRRRETKGVEPQGMDPTEPPREAVVRIASADSADLVAAVAEARAQVVLLAGCRLLRRQTLAAMPCPVLNYHAGITPKYRGMNGGYWALATGDPGNFGTTVHLVDAGVDTGAVLYQARGRPLPGDTIATYALTQAAFSRDICIRAIEDAVAGHARPVTQDLPSQQWYHPTIWRYLWTGMIRGVW